MNVPIPNPPGDKQCTRSRQIEEDSMSTEYTGHVPKIGEHVEIADKAGKFEVVDVNTLMQTANLKAMDGEGHVTRNVSWTSLKFHGIVAGKH
jgi:hypothetical protein